MLKRNITYDDFNGDTVTEAFYFHFSKPELIKMEVGKEKGMEAYINLIAKTNDRAKVLALFEELILMSYGEKSPDGKRFIKNEQLREEFSQSAAYAQMFMDLTMDVNVAVEFIKGVMPKDMGAELDKALVEATKVEVVDKVTPN